MSSESSQFRRLYRSNQNRMIAGVCGGIAEYLNVDPTLVRLGFVLLTLAGASGILLYIVMAIIVPRSPTGISQPTGPIMQFNLGAVIMLVIGLALVAFGATSALEQIAPWLLPYLNFWSPIRFMARFFWAAIVMAIGLIIIATALRRR